MTQVSDKMTAYDALLRAVPDHGPDWLTALRDRGRARWQELGLPSYRDEEWRLTRLQPLLDFEPTGMAPEQADVSRDGLPFTGESLYQLTLVNGRLDAALSNLQGLPPGVAISVLDPVGWEGVEGDLNTLIGETDLTFAQLNTAVFPQLVVMRLAKDAVLDKPLHVLHITAGEGGQVAAPRLLVVAEQHAEATLIEQFVSADADAATMTTAAAEFVVNAGAHVDHYRLQNEGGASRHLGATCISVARDAIFRSHAVTLGGCFTRNDVQAVFTGENAECTLNGLYMAKGDEVVDNHTALDHALPNCNSYQVYKGILDDKAAGVFNGKIFVRQDAQKTDAKQTNRALLLSDDARVNTKPQLEIFADDVKCTHGATIGQLDEEAVYYLRSRGLDDATARAMLTHAFAGEAMADVQYEPFMDEIDRLVHAKFDWQDEFD